MPSSLFNFYKDKINHYDSLIQAVRKKLALTALGRACSFLGLAVSLYYLYSSPSWFLSGGVLLFLAGFILLIRWTWRLKESKALWEQLLFVNNNELGLLNRELNGFPDGSSLLDGQGYLDDLDIFGKASLFHQLNRTTTSHGQDALSGLLRQSLQSPSAIRERQEAIRILTAQVDPRQLLTAKGLIAGEKEGNLHSLTQWLAGASKLYNQKALTIARWVLVVYNLVCVGLWMFTDNYKPLLIGVLVAWAFIGVYGKYINEQHTLIGKKQAVLDQYAVILNVFNGMDPGDSVLLRELQSRTGKAYQAIYRLSRLASFFDQRLNVVVNILLNSLFAYDLHCLAALEKWKVVNRESFPDWIKAVGDIECLNSLAAFAFNNPGYAYPEPVSDTVPFIAADKMAHPLISAKERVANDLDAGRKERLLLVTGSNMSGKTTFLRTTGVNLLLAQCGAPVCAASFSFTPMEILTSLRVSDSLQEHTSYFMAELKKLQWIIHRLREGKPSLVLIDEILRGTNSEDKTYGSEQFIYRLLQLPCLSLFATHDLSLGKLEGERPGEVSNYCFESVIEQGELHFNYTLQRGVARNRNASFLMQKMEII